MSYIWLDVIELSAVMAGQDRSVLLELSTDIAVGFETGALVAHLVEGLFVFGV